MRKVRQAILYSDHAEIPLTQGQVAIVDLKSVPRLAPYNWSAKWDNRTQSYYARTNIDRKTVYMHRMVMHDPEGLLIDHVNHDTLDNRRKNLRSVTHKVNMENCKGATQGSTSGIRGLYLQKQCDNGVIREYYQCYVTDKGITHRKSFKATPENKIKAINWLILKRRELFGVPDAY